MAPAIVQSLLSRAAAASEMASDAASLGPLSARSILTARNLIRRADDERPDPSLGVVDPHNINNTAMFVLFGLIGAAFVVLGIWFFFWAKNGGFYFKENDWDDYKSTVLRRRGPNGTILSNATPSTDLGGGSIYKDVDDGTTTDVSSSTHYRGAGDDDARTTVTDSTYMTGITAGVSNIGAREARRKKKEARERERERRREERAAEKRAAKKKSSSSGRRVGADGALLDEEAEEKAKEQLRSYRHERPARVGGINKESDASTWDGSTNPSASSASGTRSDRSEATELLGGGGGGDDRRQKQQQSTPPPAAKKSGGGIRKVYSTADKVATREAERVRAEARRLQEKGRSHMSSAAGSSAVSSSSSAAASSAVVVPAAGPLPRRDFSFQRGQPEERERFAMRRIDEDDQSAAGGYEKIPGSYVDSEYTGSEVGTKAYHHPIPELTASSLSGSGVQTNDFAYQDDKRRQRRGGGYRRA